MGSAKKRRSNESRICVPSKMAHSIEYRDIYVNFSSLCKQSVVSLIDEVDGDIYRVLPSSLGAGPPTRIHYQNTTDDMKFSDEFLSTIEQVHVNLYLQNEMEEDENGNYEPMTVIVQLEELWHLLTTFLGTVKSVVVRLAEPDNWEVHGIEKIGENMIYDDPIFFDIDKVKVLCRVFERVELHVKCNAIQAEHVPDLIEFFNVFNKFRRLLIYISEFKLYLKSICVVETEGNFKSLNVNVKVTQVDEHVTITIGAVRIRFEDEFRALEFRNFDF